MGRYDEALKWGRIRAFLTPPLGGLARFGFDQGGWRMPIPPEDAVYFPWGVRDKR